MYVVQTGHELACELSHPRDHEEPLLLGDEIVERVDEDDELDIEPDLDLDVDEDGRLVQKRVATDEE